MAWQRHPARLLLFALLGSGGPIGCSDPNPAFDGSGPSAPTEATGQDDGLSSASSTTVTDTSPTDGVDVSGGTGTCDEAEAGVEVTVTPVGGWPNGMCAPLVGTGLLVITAGGYEIHETCDVGLEPLVLDIRPKGPAGALGENYCVDYDITFRDGCGLERAIFTAPGGETLIYVAGTSNTSPVADAFSVTEIPLTGVCACDEAACCPGALAPGPYALGVMAGGQSEEVRQGTSKTLVLNAGSYEFNTLQARVLQECSDPMQFDWYFRRVDGG